MASHAHAHARGADRLDRPEAGQRAQSLARAQGIYSNSKLIRSSTKCPFHRFSFCIF
jgi:hypothetical protein